MDARMKNFVRPESDSLHGLSVSLYLREKNGSYVLSSRSSTTGGGSTGRLSTVLSVQVQLDYRPW